MADVEASAAMAPDGEGEPQIKPNTIDHDSQSDTGDREITIASPQRKKRTRLRQACDACRLRKVRCDEGNPPCKPCQAQGLLCAYTRARKKPGPPVRRTKDLPRAHPEQNGLDQSPMQISDAVSAAGASASTPTKSTRLVSLPPGSDQSEGVHRTHRTPSNATFSPSVGQFPDPLSQGSAAGGFFNTLSPVITGSSTFPALPAYRMDISTDLLLPRETLRLLLKDFFFYIYPLNPIVHEPSFTADFNAERDKSDPMFLSLIFAMCTITIISFPRKLQSYCQGRYYNTAIQMAERSHRLALLARPVDYLERLDVTLLSSLYLLSLSAWYSNNTNRGSFYFAELSLALTILERASPSSQFNNPDFSHGFMSSNNLITMELRKRIFWITVVGEISRYSMEGKINLPLFLKYNSADLDQLYVDTAPAEIDDAYITPTSFDFTTAHMEQKTSHLVGFNACSKIHLVYAKYVATCHNDETGVWRSVDPELKRRVLKTFLGDMKTALDRLPPGLKLDMRMAEANAGTDTDGLPLEMVPWPASATTDGDIYLSMQAFLGRKTLYQAAAELPDGVNIPDPDRHEISYEVQKANLYVTQLYLFSIFLSDYARVISDLSSGTGKFKFVSPNDEIDITHDTDYICRAMLVVMRCIKFEHLEPNGQSIIAKIRIIAASLLNDIRNDVSYGQQPSTPSSTSSFANKARTEAYLVAFLELLNKLAGENNAEDRGWLQGLRNEQA
ncbi:hypothetical protein DRE_04281 [Drechslerella stenobrocha 248]|uniref:Zn(2)-C6 fungal-type domain-containing protein n=1 Tax=Drechslerella stenobrocha 248 TaxID=1043628 RepID=W7I324_9PEZI|nr:hypothetical protein DRE_04281 [Drechslerella stenobrocha 248]